MTSDVRAQVLTPQQTSSDGSVPRLKMMIISLPDKAIPPEVRWQMFHGGCGPVSSNFARQMLCDRARFDVLQGHTSPWKSS